MINWRVMVNGEEPHGSDHDRNNCWFPDFDHQEFLLPYFNVGDSVIDQYGTTTFLEADLRRLKSHLQHWGDHWESKPDTWLVSDIAADKTTTIRLDREKILAVVNKTVEMIERALAQGGTLVFFAD